MCCKLGGWDPKCFLKPTGALLRPKGTRRALDAQSQQGVDWGPKAKLFRVFPLDSYIKNSAKIVLLSKSFQCSSIEIWTFRLKNPTTFKTRLNRRLTSSFVARETECARLQIIPRVFQTEQILALLRKVHTAGDNLARVRRRAMLIGKIVQLLVQVLIVLLQAYSQLCSSILPSANTVARLPMSVLGSYWCAF